MRNLQKILALVLAMVMSFSLVTTAGAFSDDGDITESYNDSVKVLNALEVFKGYDNGATFQPKGSITRAEVAAIIYRIATGDVKDAQASIYSTYGQFTDVLDGSWYAGYVNYCANAGYIKGRGNKIFDPQGKVTGYEALAMILRAIGYDKNNEFTGSNWQIRTASFANERGITKNVTSGMLGQAATREMVAEILFRSILVKKVNFNANMLNYTEAATSLGYDTFKLEEVTGVVTANEFADLYDTDVLAVGKTSLEVAPGDVRTLDYTTELTDIGEKQNAYITDTKVLAMAKHDDVKTFETNAKLDVSTSKKFEDKTGFKQTDDTEFYVNFGHDADWQSDWRIAFELTGLKGNGTDEYATKEAFANFIKDKWGITISNVNDSIKTSQTDNKTEVWVWRVEFKIDEHITTPYQEVIEYIFNVADKRIDKARDYVTGEVYVGTTSVKDVSDELSFKQFKKEYIKEDIYDTSWNTANNGEWVKVIDNNNDGKAEYAFKTQYWLDEATHSRTKNDKTEIEYKYLDSDDYDIRYLDGYEPAVEDVVLYTLIDGQALVQKVNPVKVTVNKIDFKNETISTTDSNEYGQSGIFNKTDMDDIITVMDEKVEYNLYMDKYGYVRAYELTEGTKYALLTELYYGYYQNGRFVTSKDLTVEMRAGSAKVDEYAVTNSRNNEFLSNTSWWNLGDPYKSAYVDIDKDVYNAEDQAKRNILQTATAHLSLKDDPNQRFSGPDKIKGDADHYEAALTNVAKYVMSDDGVKINSVAEYAYEKETGKPLFYNKENGKWVKNTTKKSDSVPVYAVDYIQLDASKEIKEDQRVYAIDISATSKNNVDDLTLLNTYVNAVHDTEFYLVSTNVKGDNNRVTYFTDYEKVSKIEADKINAVYAVARNTESDNENRDYWVADVIVIEVDDWTDDYDSISLAYYTDTYRTSTVRDLDTINNKLPKEAPTTIEPDPDEYTWNFRDWDDSKFGFYRLYDTTVDGSTITVDSLRQITKNFNDFKIYAGEITRIDVVDGNRDNYIMVDIGKGQLNEKDVNVKDDVNDKATYSLIESDNQNNWKTVANHLHMCEASHSDVKKGDRIIWIGDKTAQFIVVVDYVDDGYVAPAWLYNTLKDANGKTIYDENGYAVYDPNSLYGRIWNDQTKGVTEPKPETSTFDVKYVEVDAEGKETGTLKTEEQKTVNNGSTQIVDCTYAGYTVQNVTVNGTSVKNDVVDGKYTATVNENTSVVVSLLKNAEGPTEYIISDVKFVDSENNEITLTEAYTLNAAKNIATLNLPANYTFASASYENNGATVTVSALGEGNTIDLSNAGLTQNVVLTIVLTEDGGEENVKVNFSTVWIQNDGNGGFTESAKGTGAYDGLKEVEVNEDGSYSYTVSTGNVVKPVTTNFILQKVAVVDGSIIRGVYSDDESEITFTFPEGTTDAVLVFEWITQTDYVAGSEANGKVESVDILEFLAQSTQALLSRRARARAGEDASTIVKSWTVEYGMNDVPAVITYAPSNVESAEVTYSEITKKNYPSAGFCLMYVEVTFTGTDLVKDDLDVTLGVDSGIKEYTVTASPKAGDEALAGATCTPVTIEAGVAATVTVELETALAEELTVAVENAPEGVTVGAIDISEDRLSLSFDVTAATVTDNITLTIVSRAPEKHNVSVVIDYASIAEGVTLELVRVGNVDCENKQSVMVPSVQENSKLEIEVKMTPAEDMQAAPYIVGNNSVDFKSTNSGNTRWTASVGVTKDTRIIKLSAEEYIPVEVKFAKDIVFNGTTSDGTASVEKNAIKYMGTTLTEDGTVEVKKYGPVEVTISVPENHTPQPSIPQVPGEDDAEGENLENGGYEFSCTPVAGSENEWRIVLTELFHGDGDGNDLEKVEWEIKTSTTPTVHLSKINENVAFDKADWPAAKTGTTVVVYVKEGYQPKFEHYNSTENGYEEVGTELTNKGKTAETPAGMVCWEAKLDVTRSETIRVTHVKYPQIKVNNMTGDDANVRLTKYPAGTTAAETIDAPAGKATFYVFVNKGYVPTVAEGAPETLTISAVRATDGETDSRGWTKYEMSVEGVAMVVEDDAETVPEITLSAVPARVVTLTHAPGDEMTITPPDGIASDKDGKAVYAVITNVNMIPVITAAECSKFVGSDVTDEDVATYVSIKPGTVNGDRKSWTVTLSGITTGGVQVEVGLQSLPSVSMGSTTEGFKFNERNTYVTKTNPSDLTDDGYTVDLFFTLKDGFTLEGAAITVSVDETNMSTLENVDEIMTVTKPYRYGDGANDYRMSITFKSGNEIVHPNSTIYVNITAIRTYNVNVDLSKDTEGHIHAIAGQPLEKTVKINEYAVFKVRVDSGYQIKANPKEYTVNGLGSFVYEVSTVKAITADKTLYLESEPYKDPKDMTYEIINNSDAENEEKPGHISAITMGEEAVVSGTVESDGTIGEISLAVDAGYIPTVLVKDKNGDGTADIATVKLTYDSTEETPTWKVNVSDITVSIKITFDTIPVVKGDGGETEEGFFVGTGYGSTLDGIVVSTGDEALVGNGVAYTVALTDEAINWTNGKRDFVIYVKSGYSVDEPAEGYNLEGATVEVTRVLRADDYDTWRVTLVKEGEEATVGTELTLSVSGPEKINNTLTF